HYAAKWKERNHEESPHGVKKDFHQHVDQGESQRGCQRPLDNEPRLAPHADHRGDSRLFRSLILPCAPLDYTRTMSQQRTAVSRRTFLESAGAGLALTALKGRAIAGQKPNNQIVLGMIGVGGMGSGRLREFLKHPDVP